MTDNPRIDALRRRVQNDPASIAFAQLAEEYRRAGQYAEAVEMCRAGLAVHPGYLSARVTLGRALIELGDLPAAQTELERVLGGAPDNLSAIRGLAEIHHRRGQVSAALAQYQSALRLAPNDPDLEEMVGNLARQAASLARSESHVEVPRPAEGPSDPLVAGRDRAGRTVAALEEFLAAIHAAGANRQS